MHGVIRQYSGTGSKELFDALEKNAADVERIIRAVNGFVSYNLIRTADGGVSVTVCQDKAGCDESVRAAAEWIRQNAPISGLGAPSVSEGSTILALK